MMTRITNRFRPALKGLNSPAERSRLPARVLLAIHRNDEMSEILVKLIQIIIFTGFGALYFFAPNQNTDTQSQVPLVLGIYLFFTVLALGIAWVRKMPAWGVYLSIVIDVVLLTYLIWSFHIQYGQPASFSLKAPAMLNYFILIGVRALRFDARYVLAAGIMAIICWTTLVMYVVFNDPSDPMITRDYITYLTSNSVLIGAEINKIFSLAIFTVILALAVRRAHAFLVTAISEGKAAEELARFMPDDVAEQIRGSDEIIEAGQGIRRDMAILNVDIRGFTTMVQDMEPGEAVALLSDYQHQVVPIVHQHGGLVDKYMGDGIMITFGASEPDPKYCANALRCAQEILQQHRVWQGPAADLDINLAIASGPAIYGAIGDGDRLEYTVIGPAVNRSAKLEKYNKKLATKALCDQKTYKAALKQGYSPTAKPRIVSVDLSDGLDPLEIVVLEEK